MATRWESLLTLLALGAFVHPLPSQTQFVEMPERGPARDIEQIQYTTAPAASVGSTTAYEPWSPERWHAYPILRSTPRMGWFVLPGKGPGYFSLWDFIHDLERDKASPSRFGNPFYENDYRYLDKPNAVSEDWADFFKRLHLSDRWMFTFGGEERLRFINEIDSRLTSKNNQFQLLRSRLYGDAWHQDRFRVFAEFFDARSFNEDLPPVRSDVDHADVLNLFVDCKVLDLANGPVYVRGGQQELLYGSQRLVSPPDWSNTRRTFRGVKGFYRGDRWDADIFWARPVIPAPSQFDDVDNTQDFAGAWLTCRPVQGQSLDLYYLMRHQGMPVDGFQGVKGTQNTHTVGGRYAGDKNRWLWDVEVMTQLGNYANQDLSALAVTCGLGYSFSHLPLEPTFWIYNDFASGTQRPGATSERHTFNQLFPSGHSYFGYLDQVGRQNINDVNLQLYLRPTKWITTLLQSHCFYLDSARDALYNAQGNVVRQDPTGQAGRQVGNEIDVVTTFRLSAHQEFSVGYSRLFAGEFLRRTGPAVSPELFYVQYYFRW